MNSIKSILMAAAVFAAAAMTSCTTMNQTGLMQAAATGMQALTLSNADIQSYVKQSVAYMDAQNRVAPASNAYTQRLNKLVAGLNEVNGTPLNFKVYLTNDVNAFACADGSVRVYSGIMDMMDDDELLGIIGHEIGHVAMEHSKNAFKQELMNTALLEALGSTSNTAAALTNTQLAALSKSMLSAKFSRKQEDEADEFGYNFLKAAGRNPYSMVKSFQKMQKLEQNGGMGPGSTYLQQMFSDHPATSARIEHITKLCKRDGYIK